MTIHAIIFDFDGVLVESEYLSSMQIARVLTSLGHPTTVDDALRQFTGLGGDNFIEAVADWIGQPVPDAFYSERKREDMRVLAEGIDAVAGAVAFVESLPATMPRAIASSSSSAWIQRHLDHIGLRDTFGEHLYSGREHVKHGKPSPDIYHFAAAALGVAISETLIIEDSVVGVTGALASGARVIGLAAGRHCTGDHIARLRGAGAKTVATSFDEIASLIYVCD